MRAVKFPWWLSATWLSSQLRKIGSKAAACTHLRTILLRAPRFPRGFQDKRLDRWKLPQSCSGYDNHQTENIPLLLSCISTRQRHQRKIFSDSKIRTRLIHALTKADRAHIILQIIYTCTRKLSLWCIKSMPQTCTHNYPYETIPQVIFHSHQAI